MSAVPLELHQCYGYKLYARDGKPFVVRDFVVKERDANGVVTKKRCRERLELVRDQFGNGVNGNLAFFELNEAWLKWTEWNHANGRG